MSKSPNWRIEVTPRAERELKRLPAQEQARIHRALDNLAVGLRLSDVQKLGGRENELRLRVGDYRVLFGRDRDARVIIVLHVLPRSRAYRGD